MNAAKRLNLARWTVDYGDGSKPKQVIIPHAWRQDVPVSLEGPVTYLAAVDFPRDECTLRFHGVSYACEVFLDGHMVAEHRGIWDAFDVPVDPVYRNRTVEVQVQVIKNGGPLYPVREVASGFLPYVFHTFGGLYQPVELIVGEAPPLDSGAPPQRVRVEGHKIFFDDRPFYPRGLLHWGWYPEVGHPNAPEETIRREVQDAKALGFNMVKFCLWVPPHSYFDILEEEGMVAWLELPLWDPTDDPEKQEQIAREMERIVRQYRHHDNIVTWTVGCELSGSTSAEYRRYLTQLVRNLTGSPLIKDNSGGAEMYGGDLREFGDIYDFHPYCDTQFYPVVLDSLLPGARKRMPILLGEFNDVDVHRDLPRLADEMPYWASALSELNAQGVRWQHDLPAILRDSRFVHEPKLNAHEQLLDSSRGKALFIRKFVQEAVRARDGYAGYVITGWRETPISTAGMFDDWGYAKYSPEDCAAWNGSGVMFTIPNRRPPWINGGNRPGNIDNFNHFPGQIYLRIGVHSERALSAGLLWRILDCSGSVVARGAEDTVWTPALESVQVGDIDWRCEVAGEYVIEVEYADLSNSWKLWVVDPLKLDGWSVLDPARRLEGLVHGAGPDLIATRWRKAPKGARMVAFLTDEGTVPMPFWRESAFEFRNDEFWSQVPFAEKWERLLPISPDRALDPDWLAEELGDYEVLMNRIDVRTYKEHPMLVRSGDVIVTTLRPYGGLGIQPSGVNRNPAGAALIRALTSPAVGTSSTSQAV